MLALRLTRGAHPAVQLRRVLVALASAGTGFLLLCALGYAMSHAENPSGSALRLAWCLTPLAATVHLAVAVARTDPATKPRPGLSAIGLGPSRLMTISAMTTALSCTLGSLLALLLFLQLRGDLTGLPFDGAASAFLAADQPLPLPASLTLLALVPAISSVTVALVLAPRYARPTAARTAARRYGRFGAYGRSVARETFGTYGRFGAHRRGTGHRPAAAPPSQGHPASSEPAPVTATPDSDPTQPAAPHSAPAGLPWGISVLTVGLAVQAYAGSTSAVPGLALPGGLTSGTPAVVAGWALTALGLALAGPGLTHLCGRLLQAARPGALRLLAGRVLMEEATRIGRPLGVVSAAASGAFAMTALYQTSSPSLGPLTTVGTFLVTGCTVATLLTTAVEAKHARADTTAALLRLGAPTTMLRGAAALRAGTLLALFGPLTLIVAELAALPLAR
ncbi:hypothetical protein [Streptomyces sp. NBC_00078]|uniref:hypothetical protein n=1 Tax=unclassified Streptomyces TaxID=2593676 RepID=UPI0022524772|nr:hypothetical protein [Streptomyces sp. NBC_00078]MCX5423993.1 hypothetical protein [Streptomyces sp. NBC_00078]